MCGKPTDAKIPLCCFTCLTEWMNEQYGDNKPNKQIDNVGWETNLWNIFSRQQNETPKNK